VAYRSLADFDVKQNDDKFGHSFQYTYFIGVDNYGHMFSGDSPSYASALRDVNDNLSLVLMPIHKENGRAEDWTIIAAMDRGHLPPLDGRGMGFSTPVERGRDHEFLVAKAIGGDQADDRLDGDAGRDCFVFSKKCGADVVEDFNLKKDFILLDTDLAKNMKQVKKSIEDHDDGVVMHFAKNDSVKIEGIEPSDIKKIDFLFLDI
jgi:hypothetical protein